MAGIHVSRLPSNISDKQIKVYFGNPRNGGGHVAKVVHPLPRNSAVVLFDDEAVVAQVLDRQHQMMNHQLEVTRLQKAVFTRVVAEVDPHVSASMSQNAQLIDELRIIGEVEVNTSRGGQTYVLTGSWYQLEWALHYLDTAVDTLGFAGDTHEQPMVCGTNIPTSGANAEQSPRSAPSDESSASATRHIVRPNVPALKRPAVTEPSEKCEQAAAGHGSEPSVKRHKNKNKNVAPRSVTKPEEDVSSETGSGRFDATLLRNLNDDAQSNDDFVMQQNNLNAFGVSGDEAFRQLVADQAVLFAQYGLQGLFSDSDSGSENESDTSGRHVSFHPDTVFHQRHVPEMTRGIDVAHIAGDETNLSFAFKMADKLTVQVAKDDITKQTTNAIVNPTTSNLSCMTGVSRAIMHAGGHDLQIECRQHVERNGDLKVTQVVHTAAGGQLNPNASFVLHAFGPNWRETESEMSTHLLVCTYLNCLVYADQKLWAKSLSTPLISAGSYGFPLDVCVSAFYDALLLYVSHVGPSARLTTINLICYDEDSAGATIMIMQSLLDCDTTQAAAAAMDRYGTRKINFDFAAELLETTVLTNDDVTIDDDDDVMDDEDVEVNVDNKPKASGQNIPEKKDVVKENIDDDDKEVNDSVPKQPVEAGRQLQNMDDDHGIDMPSDQATNVEIKDQLEYPAKDNKSGITYRVVDESEDSENDNEHPSGKDNDLENAEPVPSNPNTERKEQEATSLPEEIEEGIQDMNLDDGDVDNNEKDVTIKAEAGAEKGAIDTEKKDTSISTGNVENATHNRNAVDEDNVSKITTKPGNETAGLAASVDSKTFSGADSDVDLD